MARTWRTGCPGSWAIGSGTKPGKPSGASCRRLSCQPLESTWTTIEDAPSEAPRPAGTFPTAEAPIPIPEWPDPPEDAAFHGLAGEVVRLIEPSSEADPVGVLLQLLIGFGNAVGSGLWVVADGHSHHANEYGVTVGDTSRARKGTGWRRVRPILAHVDSGWADNRITHGLSSGEGLIWEIRDPILGTDKKTGSMVITDPGVDDKRVMVVESEFGNVLRVLAREGNTLSGVLRLGWDGDDLRTMTKHSPARATKPHVSLAGHITQQELAKYLAHVEIFNGLGNRILWACVRRSKLLPFGGSIDDKSMLDLGSRLAAAADLARGVGTMIWTSTGKTLWESEYRRPDREPARAVGGDHVPSRSPRPAAGDDLRGPGQVGGDRRHPRPRRPGCVAVLRPIRCLPVRRVRWVIGTRTRSWMPCGRSPRG